MVMVGLAGVTAMEVNVAPALSGRSISITLRNKKIMLKITPADAIRLFISLLLFMKATH
jgi:hypothetical protein